MEHTLSRSSLRLKKKRAPTRRLHCELSTASSWAEEFHPNTMNTFGAAIKSVQSNSFPRIFPKSGRTPNVKRLVARKRSAAMTMMRSFGQLKSRLLTTQGRKSSSVAHLARPTHWLAEPGTKASRGTLQKRITATFSTEIGRAHV